MLASRLPDDGAFAGRLPEYFPAAMRAAAGRWRRSPRIPWRREIVTTATVNEIVNGAGYRLCVPALRGDGRLRPQDAIRAYTVDHPRCSACRALGGDRRAGNLVASAQIQDIAGT